jgi:hypothetical protein
VDDFDRLMSTIRMRTIQGDAAAEAAKWAKARAEALGIPDVTVCARLGLDAAYATLGSIPAFLVGRRGETAEGICHEYAHTLAAPVVAMHSLAAVEPKR